PADAVAHRVGCSRYSRRCVVGERVAGCREEHAIPPGSLTETFAALRLFVDNWRWAGVPFYIRAGKRLPKRATEIRVAFKKPPHLTFGRDAAAELETNAITLRIQPEEGISLRFGAKVPSAGVKLRSVTMDFDYASSFLVETPEAYERLLLDCMIGDPTLFTRADEVEAAWALIDPIEAAWRDGGRTGAPAPPQLRGDPRIRGAQLGRGNPRNPGQHGDREGPSVAFDSRARRAAGALRAHRCIGDGASNRSAEPSRPVRAGGPA